MIHWMSEKVEKAWDNHNDIGLVGLVCEIHDEALKGHIVIQLEIGDDYSYQLDLGDCRGLADADINRRFVERFPEFVRAYEASEECIGPLMDDLWELADDFENAINNG